MGHAHYSREKAGLNRSFGIPPKSHDGTEKAPRRSRMDSNHVIEVYDYNLRFRGVFGRNRTEKFKITRLTRRERTAPQPTPEEVELMVKRALNDLGVKRGKWAIDRDPVELKDGFEIFVLMSGTTILTGQV